jgi:N-methylhydantoinase B/oxoprolinase/acetone carboxylase alpha subunit
MPFLTAITLLAQAASALPAVPAHTATLAYAGQVACNPDPSKNRGCFRPLPGKAKAQTVAIETANRNVVACNPDPSKNRGCFKPLDTPDKAAVLAQAD